MAGLVFYRHPVNKPNITGRFGDWYSNALGVYRHRGVDYGQHLGERIFAPAPGRSVHFINDGSFGNAVCLDHQTTPWRYSLYAHMQRPPEVLIGEWVETNTLLGFVGQSGFAYGVHLHWQVCKNNSFPVAFAMSADPLQFIAEDDPMTPEEKAQFNKMAHRLSQLIRSGYGSGGETLLDSTLIGEARLDENDRAMPLGEVTSTAERVQAHLEDDDAHGA